MDKKILDKWRSDPEYRNMGHEYEEMFLGTLTKHLDFKEIERKDKETIKPKEWMICKSSEEEDFNIGIDFWIGVPNLGWVPIDLTTTTSSTEINKKRENERRKGVGLLYIDPYTIQCAERGGINFLNKIVNNLTDVIRDVIRQKTKTNPSGQGR